MATLRTILAGTAVMVFANLATAQTTDKAATPATPASPSAPAAASSNPATQGSNDPFVQKRIADKAAKDEYKQRKKAAKRQYKENKAAAKSELKAEKKESAAERNAKVGPPKNEALVDPASK